jgi:hypothetical protein
VISLKGKAKLVAVPHTVFLIVGAFFSINYILDIAALISIPSIILIIFCGKIRSSKNVSNEAMSGKLLTHYLGMLSIAVGMIGLFVSLAPLFSIPSSFIIPNNYMYEVFLFFSTISPIIILLLVMGYPIRILIRSLNIKITTVSFSNGKLKGTTKVIFLLVFMLLSTVLGLIPHLPTINKDNQQIGVDTDYYVRWVGGLLNSKNFEEFLYKAFVEQVNIHHYKGDRPISLLFLSTLAKITNSDVFFTIEHSTLILSPLLVLAVYLLTRELTSENDLIPLIASFLTAISFQTLIGIYAGFYANWLALIIGYLSFMFLMRFLKNSGKIDFALFVTLSIVLLFTHVYTWTILSIVTGVFLIIMFKANYYRKKGLILLLLVVLTLTITDIARMVLTGSASGVAQDLEKANGSAGLHRFPDRWENLYFTTLIYLGGMFSNFLILVPALYWLLRSDLHEPTNIFLLVYLSIGIIPVLFGNIGMQSRILYDIPFQIPSAIGLMYLRRNTSSVFWIPLFLWLVAFSIRSVSNFYFIPT